ncbi:DUF4924 family protein [Halosquirtibacter laminarini]|uniref:DUF4924 family protein n=1 Tax=Halosquirtibacter laminarini TaxID=3374600 RepID=A0AC61NCK4_9BACT|nr:DUF4924 family protein [Prolixibacteraceae bacterium]
MYIAEKKKKENIAEYILYLFQIEDLIRSQKFSEDNIRKNIVNQYPVEDLEKEKILHWYLNFAEMMKREHIEESGHMQFVTNQMNDLFEFHTLIVKSNKYPEYHKTYMDIQSILVEIASKMGDQAINEIQVCFSFLYGVVLLKLQKKEISEDTYNVSKQVSSLLGKISLLYNKNQEEELDIY